MSTIPFSLLPFGNLHKRAVLKAPMPPLGQAAPSTQPDLPQALGYQPQPLQMGQITKVSPMDSMRSAYGAKLPDVLDSARTYQATHSEIKFPNLLTPSLLNRKIPVAVDGAGRAGVPDQATGGTRDAEEFGDATDPDPLALVYNTTGGPAGIKRLADHELLHTTQMPDDAGVLNRLGSIFHRPNQAQAMRSYVESDRELGARLRLNRAYVGEGLPFPKSPEDADKVLGHYGVQRPGAPDLFAGHTVVQDISGAEPRHYLRGPDNTGAEEPFNPQEEEWQAFDRWWALPADTRDLLNHYHAAPPAQQQQMYDKWRKILPGTVQNNVTGLATKMSSTTFAPIRPSNLITSPAGQEDQDMKGAGPKTPLDMPAAPQTPTEAALGTDADTLALRQEHEDLKAKAQQTEAQLADSKRQIALAKADKPVPAANDSLGKYKSMSMQMMDSHLDAMHNDLKGLHANAMALPMQVKLSLALKMGNVAPAPVKPIWNPTSMSQKVVQDATSGTMPHALGAQNIVDTTDQANRLSRLTAGPAPGGMLDRASKWLDTQTGGSPFASTLRALPGIGRSMGAVLGGTDEYLGNMLRGDTQAAPSEDMKDTAALFSTLTPKLDQAQETAARPAQAAAPINWREIQKLPPAQQQAALQARQNAMTLPQILQNRNTQMIGDVGDYYSENSISKPTSDLLASTHNYYAGEPSTKGVQTAAPGVGPWEQMGRKTLDFATRLPALALQGVANAADDFNVAGNEFNAGRILPGQDQFGQQHLGVLANAAKGVGNAALTAADVMPFAGAAGLTRAIPSFLPRLGAGAATSAASTAVQAAPGALARFGRVAVPALDIGQSYHNQNVNDQEAKADMSGDDRGKGSLADWNTQINATNRSGQYATELGQAAHAQPVASPHLDPGFWGYLQSLLPSIFGAGGQLPWGVPQSAYQPGPPQPGYFDTPHYAPYQMPKAAGWRQGARGMLEWLAPQTMGASLRLGVGLGVAGAGAYTIGDIAGYMDGLAKAEAQGGPANGLIVPERSALDEAEHSRLQEFNAKRDAQRALAPPNIAPTVGASAQAPTVGASAQSAIQGLGRSALGMGLGGLGGYGAGRLINALRAPAANPEEQKSRDKLPTVMGLGGVLAGGALTRYLNKAAAEYPWHTAPGEPPEMLTPPDPVAPVEKPWHKALDVGPPEPGQLDRPFYQTPFKMPHPTDYLDNDSIRNWNLKGYGALDRGESPIGGAVQTDYRDATKGVNPYLPMLFSGLGKFLGLPGYSAPGQYGHQPGFQPGELQGATPFLGQLARASEEQRLGGQPGGAGGLMGMLPYLLQRSGQGSLMPGLSQPAGGPY